MPVAPVPTAPTTVIAVVGAGQADTATEAVARAVGRGLAEAGATVVTGGLGGVMAAASAGAREAGGTTIGILPGTDRREANPHVVVALPTGLGEARNALVVRAADGLVAVGGAYGTLSEIALALRAGLPVIGLGTWSLHRDGREDPGIVVATDAEDAVRQVLVTVRERA
jgi:uncharacterized protein (TIGR00725 family)